MCLIAVLVCPAFGEIAALASSKSMPCSTRACCRRADMSGGCPHGTASADHDHNCQRALCVLTCADHGAAAAAPVVLIGFSPAPITNDPRLAASALSVHAIGALRSHGGIPLTPPPRTLSL